MNSRNGMLVLRTAASYALKKRSFPFAVRHVLTALQICRPGTDLDRPGCAGGDTCTWCLALYIGYTLKVTNPLAE